MIGVPTFRLCWFNQPLAAPGKIPGAIPKDVDVSPQPPPSADHELDSIRNGPCEIPSTTAVAGGPHSHVPSNETNPTWSRSPTRNDPVDDGHGEPDLLSFFNVGSLAEPRCSLYL